MANKQIIDAMWDDSPVDVSTEVNFIWSIANKLRGPYRSDKYKDVIIPMTIIRRFECALAPTKQKVVEQFKANPNFPAKAMYRISGFQFYNTSEFDLAELVNDADHIAANFKSYLQGFSANVLEILMSKERGLNFGEEIDKMDKNNRLLSVIKAFSELDLDPRTIDNVKMGYIFEELIRKFSENAEAGDHYTGRDIIKLMVNILLAEGCDDIFDDGKVITILDQACGTGGMLSTGYNFIKRYNPSADVRLFGQEINPESYAMCLAEMLIKGQNAENICYQDTMKADRFKGTKMRFVLENPPFGTAWGGKDAAEGVEDAVNAEYQKGFDGRWGAGLPGSGDKDMAAVTMSLGSGDQEISDIEDMITDEIRRNGKQANVSMFAFTATPKPTTIQLFGRLNTKGQREAFHIYSMKQAIEEGFILDVLQNYTTYDTFYQLNKEIEEDPRCKTADAKRQIARFVELHETNIAQRVEVIVEHFRTTVMPELGGMAKAMVITASRQGAVKYRQAFENYTQKKGYTDIKALVAFSGKVKLPDDDTEYSEASMNGFPEDRLTKEFDKDDYQVLLVANKYQTGFDQPKLCAMYVLKKLKGVSAVQTLSRLNRICPPFEKKTFVLDFVNTYEDIKAAFAPYYTTTLLSTSVTPTAIYDLEAQIDAYTILDPDDIEKANELLYKGNISSKDKQKLTFYFKRAKNRIEQYELIKQHEIVSMMRHFVRFYEFLLQVSCFEDTDLHKKYNFITYLLAYINIKHPGGGYNLDGKIKATNFVQKKAEEHTTQNLVAQPVVKLPTAESFGLTEAKEERLSQIIAEINSRTGKAYDNDVAVKAMLQIRDILLKSDKLKTSARNNTVKDFEFSYFDDIDDALIEGLEQNQDFFSLLLSNDEIKRQVLGIFTDEIYKSLREA